MAEGGVFDGAIGPLVLALVGIMGTSFGLLCRSRQARSAKAAPAIRLLPTKPKPPTTFLVERSRWHEVPPWITQGRGFFGKFPSLDQDPLFRDIGDPCLLPFLPSPGQCEGCGAAIICPGGNYEFFTADEAAPIAQWLAESLGIPAYVLKYRLLPDFGLPEMLEDFTAAVRTVRQRCGPGPVVTIGFSAGAHLSAAGCAATGKDGASPPERPDAQVLVYPSLDASEWLDHKSAGFFRARVTSKQVRSLAEGPGGGKQMLVAGAEFVKPPPTFMVASTEDWVCWVQKHGDLYANAARRAQADLQYMRGPYGGHGFGLKDFWSKPCLKWLQGLGFGVVTAEAKKAM